MSRKIMGATGADVLCNCRVQHYPNGIMRASVYSADIIRTPGWELSDHEARRAECSDKRDIAGNLLRSKRRARAAVADLALSNEFKYFVTLTLDKNYVNRYDEKEVTRKLNHWLDNRVRRNGLLYILVPERHKDGAIHFHGFFNEALPAVDSGTLTTKGKPRKPRSEAQRRRWLADGAHVVYNLPQWTLGFSTAIELYGDYRSAVGYVCKYISKAEEKVGGRWYYSGGALQRPEVTYHKADFKRVLDTYDVQPYAVEALGCYGVTFDFEEGDSEWILRK